MGYIIHPKIREGINPPRKNIHIPKENGGKNVESFSKDISRLNSETNPHFKGFWEEVAGFFIWVSLLSGEFWVDGRLARQFT